MRSCSPRSTPAFVARRATRSKARRNSGRQSGTGVIDRVRPEVDRAEMVAFCIAEGDGEQDGVPGRDVSRGNPKTGPAIGGQRTSRIGQGRREERPER